MNLEQQVKFLDAGIAVNRENGDVFRARILVKERRIVEHKIEIRILQKDMQTMNERWAMGETE